MTRGRSGRPFSPWTFAGPLAFALAWWLADGSLGAEAQCVLAVTCWVAVWWIAEPVPIPVTSLLPLVLLPLLGARPARDVARLYFNDLIFLLLGGFLLALTIERWGLHRRIALGVLQRVGTSPRRLCLGFVMVSALLSMWISNTATVLVLVPIALAVISRLEEVFAAEDSRRTRTALLLGIAYGANFGGIGTYIGTPPNLIFIERYTTDFRAGEPGGAPAIGFLNWLLALGPMVLLFIPLVWWLLACRLPRSGGGLVRESLREEVRSLRPWSRGERMVAALFGVTALLWVTRQPLRIGSEEYLGWSRLLPDAVEVTDATVAIAMVIVAFLLRAPARGLFRPAEREGESGVPLLEWRDAEQRLPWGILLLFGGGLALGDSFQTSGLAHAIGQGLSETLAEQPPLGVIGAITTLITFLTEVTSNTATATVMLQILSAVAPALDMPPAAVLLPAALAASCAFMLPVATAPNAIVFGTGKVSIRAMALHGFLLNWIAICLISLYLYFVALPFLGITFSPQ